MICINDNYLYARGIGWEPRPGLGHTYQFISYDIITMVEISHDVKKMIIENQPVIYLELMDEDCRNRAEKKRNKQGDILN